MSTPAPIHVICLDRWHALCSRRHSHLLRRRGQAYWRIIGGQPTKPERDGRPLDDVRKNMAA